MLLVFGAPCQLRSLAGQEHGRTIPLAVIAAAINLHCNKRLDATYSITSSAVASSVGGTSTPSVLAVLRLMTSSNLVG